MTIATRLALLTLFCLLAVVIACNRSAPGASPAPSAPTATPTPSPTPLNPQAILEESGLVMAGLDSFRFRMEHEGGGTPVAQGLVLVRVEGTVVKPDRISAEFGGSLGGFAVKANIISIGPDSYMTNPLNGNWEVVPQEVSPLSFFDPQSGIASIMPLVTQPALVSSNRETHTILGQLKSEDLAFLFGYTLQGADVTAEAVIDAETLHLLRVTLKGLITPGESEGVVRIIRLSDFDEPFESSRRLSLRAEGNVQMQPPSHGGQSGVPDGPYILFVTGIMAAGKSTVAQALAERLPKSVHLRGDAFRRLIVNGAVAPLPPMSDEAFSQLRLRYRIAAMAAHAYCDSGFTVVYQDIAVGPMLDEVIGMLRGKWPVYVVVLCPSAEVVAERDASRAKTGYGAWTPAMLDGELRTNTTRVGLWLDTSHLSVDETVQAILARLDEARLRRTTAISDNT